MTLPIKRVLSIQSHVVHGFVGNKVASFILQTLDYNVDLINSVHFSNHTGYPSFNGCELAETDLVQIIDSLKSNSLLNYSWILSGYMKSSAFVFRVASIVKKMKSENPDMLYLCDPVMGDDGVMYVDSDSRDTYKNSIIPLADMITPNFFEFQLLTDTAFGDTVMRIDEIMEHVESLHLKGPKYIVITSIEGIRTNENDEDELLLLGSTYDESTKSLDWFQIQIPKFNTKFTGTGDVFSALLLHYFTKYKSLHDACVNVVVIMRKILHGTIEQNLNQSYIRELKLIEHRDAIQSVGYGDLFEYGLEKLGLVKKNGISIRQSSIEKK